MENRKYIKTRFMNLADTMPLLSTDLSISETCPHLFICMIATSIGNNSFDYVTIGYKTTPEGYAGYPIGIIEKAAHPHFITEYMNEVLTPSVWAGGARFEGHKFATFFLRHQIWAGSSLKQICNINKIAETVFETFHTQNSTVTYAGHKMLSWQ